MLSVRTKLDGICNLSLELVWLLVDAVLLAVFTAWLPCLQGLKNIVVSHTGITYQLERLLVQPVLLKAL